MPIEMVWVCDGPNCCSRAKPETAPWRTIETRLVGEYKVFRYYFCSQDCELTYELNRFGVKLRSIELTEEAINRSPKLATLWDRVQEDEEPR